MKRTLSLFLIVTVCACVTHAQSATDAVTQERELQKDMSFLKGKKFADLTKGEYVSRGKYNELEEKNKKYADYDTIKKESAEYKAKEKQSTLIGIAKSVNVADEFIEFVLSKVNIS